MKIDAFTSFEFGRPGTDAGGYLWFDPAPMPRQLSLSPETQLALSAADMAIGRLAGVGRMLRAPGLITRPYMMREALASASIEGTQATLTDVFQAQAARESISINDAAAVTSHTAALELGMTRCDGEELTLGLIRDIHACLLRHAPVDKRPGQLRDAPVWLGSPNATPESAVFVPPVGVRMGDALSDWMNFLVDRPKMPLLIRAALLHYQFLTIHPFVDGNGRVGRMLVQLLLHQERRLPAPFLYLSSYFASNRREYYDRLQNVRQHGEIQDWLQYFLTAVAVQAEDGVVRAEGILDLREQYRAELANVRGRTMELMEALFENPVTTTAEIRERLGVSTQGALNLIRGLEARGWVSLLGNFGKGGATFWIASEILNNISRSVDPPVFAAPAHPPDPVVETLSGELLASH